MQLASISTDHAATLSVLVNDQRIRSSIKRLFHNHIEEVIAEIFQNSQRSGASTVSITTTKDSFTIQDNGHGLLEGVDGFHTLLKLAQSRFDNNTIEDQDPMGIGIVSLLTHDQITEVTFSSGKLKLTVNTKRWWEDPEYYSVWYQRLVTLTKPVTGLRITAKCAPALIDALHAGLKPKDVLYSPVEEPFRSASPAQGYDGILKISLNGQPVSTALPAWTRIQDKLIETTYQGCKITIGCNPSTVAHRHSSIVWYGQLIRVSGLSNAFDFQLVVTAGRPVNPLSPSRTGIINDAANAKLMAFIKEQLFSYIFDLKNRARINPRHVAGCFRVDNERATRDSPYFIAEEITTSPTISCLEDLNSNNEQTNLESSTLFTYDQPPVLLKSDEVVILRNDKTLVENAYGLQSFLSDLEPVFTLECGDQSRLSINTLWWKPDGDPTHKLFYQPGSYGISAGDTTPTTWLPITHTPVFAFTESTNYDVFDVDFTVGVANSVEMMSFLSDQVWAAFSPDEDHDFDPQETNYRDSVDEIIRSIIGKCVPHDFKLSDLQRFLEDKLAPVISVTYHYQRNTKFYNPKTDYNPKAKDNVMHRPSEITVKSAIGEKLRLKLY